MFIYFAIWLIGLRDSFEKVIFGYLACRASYLFEAMFFILQVISTNKTSIFLMKNAV